MNSKFIRHSQRVPDPKRCLRAMPSQRSVEEKYFLIGFGYMMVVYVCMCDIRGLRIDHENEIIPFQRLFPQISTSKDNICDELKSWIMDLYNRIHGDHTRYGIRGKACTIITPPQIQSPPWGPWYFELNIKPGVLYFGGVASTWRFFPVKFARPP